MLKMPEIRQEEGKRKVSKKSGEIVCKKGTIFMKKGKFRKKKVNCRQFHLHNLEAVIKKM